MAFGYVIDDEGSDKAKGAGEFAVSLAVTELADETHKERCPSCQILAEAFACVGVIPTPLTAATERWLVDRLPEDIESLPGFLIRKAIGDFGYEGTFGKELREKGWLAAPGPFTRHFGPFFRRFTVSSEQLLEEMLGAGDILPAHALAVLVHLGAISVDGKILTSLDEGAKLGELITTVAERRTRTEFLVEVSEEDDEALARTKQLLRALWAGFVLDVPVKIFSA